jgi:hypothetical protein
MSVELLGRPLVVIGYGAAFRDRVDQGAATRAHDNLPSVARESPRDARRDAPTATRNERSHHRCGSCA